MRIRSFRVRFLLWNVLLSGAVLLAFGAVTLGLSWRGGLERLDSDLLDNGHHAFREAHHPNPWKGAGPLWRSEYGGGADRVSLALLIREQGTGTVVLQSEAWPEGLDGTDFADPPDSPAWRPKVRPPDFRREDPPDRRLPRRDSDENNESFRPFEDHPPPPGDGFELPPDDGFEPPPLGRGLFRTLKLSDGDWRFGVLGQGDQTLIIGVPLEPLETQMLQWIRVLAMAFVPGLFLIALTGWILTGRALRPIQTLTKTAEGITAQGLSRRLPLTREAVEFTRLTEVFNHMLDRLDRSFQQATRFSADAAHELKTPLTILQGQLEGALGDATDDNPAHQQLCASLLEEVQRLKGIVRQLLLLSLVDAGELRLNREEVDLNALVSDATEDVEILAPHLTVEPPAPGAVPVQADPVLLSQVVQNLISNAIKYNNETGYIRLSIVRDACKILLRVTNGGIPISADGQSRIFERFYRGDSSRTRAVEGTGLGLSLSREIARAHGGDLRLVRSDAKGTVFELELPLGKKDEG